MLNFSDSRNFTRTLAAICLIVTPLLLILGAIVGPETSDDAAEALADIADNDSGYVISGILFLIAPLVFVPGMMGVIRLMRRRGVTIGQVGAALIMFGALVTISFYGYGVLEYYAATEDGLDRAQMAELVDASEDGSLFIPILIGFLGGLLLGSILLAVGLWRSGIVPVWSPIALVVSAVVGFFGESTVVAVIGFVLLFAALLPIAQKLLSISDDEWEDWHLPEPGGAPPPPSAEAGVPPG